MSLSYNTLRAIPHLTDYAAAEQWERNVKPIKGDADGTKPLGNRKQKYINIKREAGGAIAINYGYMAPTIRYFPDGTMAIYSTAYPVASAQEIITEVTGLRLYTDRGKTWIEHQGGVSPMLPKGGRNGEVPNFFRKGDNGRGWICTNAADTTTHVVNRRGAKAVRARYAEATRYIEALAKLRVDSWPKPEEAVQAFSDVIPEEARAYWWRWREYLPTVRVRRFNHEHAAKFAALLSSPEPGEQYKAFLWATLSISSGSASIAKDTRNIIDHILMMHHHDEWFDAVTVPAGTKVIDRYEWAFPPQK
jgi:hypothetical protein